MKVEWRRLRSAAGIVRAYRAVLAKAAGYPARELVMSPRMFTEVKRSGMWAFVDTGSKPPVVRYWHDGRRSAIELAHMLGHELGHATGKPRRGHLAEESRADEYGEVASAVVRHLRLVGAPQSSKERG